MDAAAPLPPLRDDLRLEATGSDADGAPGWVIQDAVRNRFFRIGWLEFEFLRRWHMPPAQICSDIATHTALRPEDAQLAEFRHFLDQHQLLRPDAQASARLQRQGQGERWFSWSWFLHHYLFFRIPLLRPQQWLGPIAHALRGLFTPWAAAAVVGLTVLGIVLTLHQWDTFRAAVVESFSLNGLLSFGLALALAKALHELAHALVATRLGLRVAHMGVAFVVMFPMLYTDTGESWKLSRSRQRLAIAAAGIVCELALAGLATLGWALSEPGAWRNALLYLATTSWILSLGLNASPFMRFDGYFILSDLLDFPNLHERASAQARVALRRGLWGLDEAWPEHFAPARRRALIAFEWLTWMYRLLLFAGIAATVYFFFFKVLGLLLFCVEVGWFIVMPIQRELAWWWAQRARISTLRRIGFWLLLAALLLVLALPWRSQTAAVGVARSEHQLRVFTPFAARIEQIRTVGNVAAGSTLLTLQEPDISARISSSEAGLRGYQARLAGLLADTSGLEQQAATRQRINVQAQETQAARLEVARLTLTAPFAGRWLDVDPTLRPGQWVNAKTQLGILVDPQHWQVDAYVKQDDLQQIKLGAAVRFYPHGQTSVLAGSVLSVSSTRVKQLEQPLLASRYKGPIPVAAERDTLVPNPAVFHVLVQLDQPPPGLWETRGELQIEGERRSVLGEAGRHLLAALLRESGF